ncbi:hypothetical protein [Diplodia seriata chrysovirus 1]|nr:hypothetical protein [Diplodia seriata chrysovirus 1]
MTSILNMFRAIGGERKKHEEAVMAAAKRSAATGKKGHNHRSRTDKKGKHKSPAAKAMKHHTVKVDCGTVSAEEVEATRHNMFAIVIPSGGGKTFLAGRYGWLDCDALLDPLVKDQLTDTVMQRLVAGDTWADANSQIDQERNNTLDLVEAEEPTPVLVHSVSSAQRLGLTVVGRVAITEKSLDTWVRGRPDHEQVFARMNNQAVVEESCSAPVLWCEEHEQVAWYVKKVCSALDIPVAYDEMGVFESTDLTEYERAVAAMSVKDVVRLADDGEIPRAHADWAVRNAGLRSYGGYGITTNDWAIALAKCGPYLNADDDTVTNVFRGIDLSKLSELCELDGHDDVALLTEVHKHAPPKFLLNVLAHWKMVGIHLPIRTMIFKLHTLPLSRWNRALIGVRNIVRQTSHMFGLKLEEKERRVLSDMWLLSRYTRKGMVDAMSDRMRPYYTERKNGAFIASAFKSLELVDFDDHQVVDVGKIRACLQKSRVDTVRKLGAGMVTSQKIAANEAVKLGGKTGAERLAWALACRVMLPEAGLEGEMLTRMVLGQVAGGLGRIHRLTDEWSDGIFSGMMEEMPVQAARAIVHCSYATGADKAGEFNWAIAIERSLRQFLVTSLAAKHFKGRVVVQSGPMSQGVVADVKEAELAEFVCSLGLPRSMLDGYSAKAYNSLQVTARAISDFHSPTLRCMEVVNFNEWMPRSRGVNAVMGAVSRWWFDTKVGSLDLMRALASEHFRQATGHRLNEDRANSLYLYVHGRRSHGGMGIPTPGGYLHELVQIAGKKKYRQPDGRERGVNDMGWDLRTLKSKKTVEASGTLTWHEAAGEVSDKLTAERMVNNSIEVKEEVFTGRILAMVPVFLGMVCRALVHKRGKEGIKDGELQVTYLYEMLLRADASRSWMEMKVGALAESLTAIGV